MPGQSGPVLPQRLSKTGKKAPSMPNIPLENPVRLRQLAAWYRNNAERANAPWVCEGRLQTAENLEHHATLLEAGGNPQ